MPAFAIRRWALALVSASLLVTINAQGFSNHNCKIDQAGVRYLEGPRSHVIIRCANPVTTGGSTVRYFVYPVGGKPGDYAFQIALNAQLAKKLVLVNYILDGKQAAPFCNPFDCRKANQLILL